MHPKVEQWRGRYVHSPLGFYLASLNSQRLLRRAPRDTVAVQIYGMFRTRGKAYVMFVDCTDDMAHRDWSPWSPYGRVGRTAWQTLERNAYRRASHVFTASGVTAHSVVRTYGVAPERVSVVGGGSNFSPLPAPRSPSHEPEIIFVGREWERKGGPELLRAFSVVRREIPNARLVVAGVTGLPDQPGVHVVGMLDRRSLAQYLESAAVFCMPSRFDPFPNSIMEAMAYSLPCVSTTTAGVPEIVLHGETGLLVAPGDTEALGQALLRILRQPDFADRLGRAGRVRVERELTWDRVVDRMAPVLDRLGVAPLSR
jgi:glycosyltransferase involved in cell wall biosynthesis